jgi:putative two-component system response regulator
MRVLVVDDDRTSLLIVKMFVGLLGGEAVAVSDPEQALEDAATTDFDLAVVDVHMPKMDGISFVERLRRLKGAHMPIMMISVDDAETVRRAALRAGASEYMTKPLDRLAFTSRLEELVRAGFDTVIPQAQVG